MELSLAFLSNNAPNTAAEITLPAIIGIIHKTDIEAGKTIYAASSLYRTSGLITSTFLGAAVAGFLARRRGILAGILSSSPYLFLALLGIVVSIVPHSQLRVLDVVGVLAGNSSSQSQVLLQFILFALAAPVGGFIGQRLYAPEIDLDLGKDKVTIFGVRWVHYFWILPLICLSFLCSVLMIVYAGMIVVLACLSLWWHPSLLFNFYWNWVFPVGMTLVGLAIWITVESFVRFFTVMQHGQANLRGRRKVGRVLLYGVGAPLLSYAIAVLSAHVVHAMPEPVEGDWKIAIAIMAAIVAISAVASTISRMRGSAST